MSGALDRNEAFRSLVSTRLDASYRLATLLLGDPLEGEDATHDAIVRAWQAYPSLRDPGSLPAWFQRIVVNVCRDRMRRQRRSPRPVSLDPMLPGLPVLADATAAIPERVALASALDHLTPDHRMVVVLRYHADLTIDAIADRLGEPPGTIKSRLHHAIGSLRAAYDAAARTPEGGH
ncbi:MAG: sigma-70 family RNA polymerase sigma factor [Chloroflexi bacterium]|nr:sigma-70 family RNA polymerase sigma factor [Chloroflexota bacterium]